MGFLVSYKCGCSSAVTYDVRFCINNLVYVTLNLMKSLFWDCARNITLDGCGDRHGGSLAGAMMKNNIIRLIK